MRRRKGGFTDVYDVYVLVSEYPFVASVGLASSFGSYVVSNKLSGSKDVSRANRDDGVLDGLISTTVAEATNYGDPDQFSARKGVSKRFLRREKGEKGGDGSSRLMGREKKIVDES